ncbi:MAG: sensor histidine kinase [Legionellales bacterium]|nr:sensor histidine kinase [Legionellales bacterium]
MPNLHEQEKSSFLPNFCSAYVLFIVVLSAELLAIILTLTLPLYTEQLIFNFAMNSLYVQWVALSCVGALCMLKSFIAKLTEKKAATFSYLLILLITFIVAKLAWWSLYVYPESIAPDQELYFFFLIRSLGVAAIVGAVVLRYLYLQHQWRKDIEATALFHFQALQARIRPHFLFNCMNTIASLTRTKPDLAEQSVLDLAELFRATLLEPTELYQISDEWILCQHYIRIEGHRLGNRLHVEWDIDSLPNNALVPPLSLQPLLENSIYHGIERLPEGGTINIYGKFEDEKLIILFSNPLPANNFNEAHKGNKQAHDNIRKRLISIFGTKSDLIIENTQQQYTVKLILPYRRYENINS